MRKINPIIFFWTLVLGSRSLQERTIADFRRLYEENANVQLSRSSFYERFSLDLVRYLHVCLMHGIDTLIPLETCTLKTKLSSFKDILIQDSSIIRLHEKLSSAFPAARTRTVAAGIKLSLLVSAVSNGPMHVALHAERTAEQKTLRIGPWVRDRILLIDLGFFKYHLLARISENGGYFVTRLKKTGDPLIVGTNSTCRGRSINVVGKRLSEVSPRLKRRIIDVDVEIEFKRNKYKGKQRKDNKRFRLVGIFNEEEKRHHFYLTNILPAVLDAEEIGVLYSARWQVELIFKELKSKYGIDVIPSANIAIVRSLIWSAVLMLIVSRRVMLLVTRGTGNIQRYTTLRWATIFVRKVHEILHAVLVYSGVKEEKQNLLTVLQRQALDPNVNRKRLTDVWRA